MTETVSVNLSGPALAFLLYENVKSKHEQEGFLLGDTNEIVTKIITDTDSHKENRHKVININGVIPCPKTCLFYNNVGGINKKKLEEILGSKTTNVVGWFLYEPENNFKLTVRSKIIHKELCDMFSISSDLFCCGLLSTTKSILESTFSFTHTFIRFHNGQFSTVPMHIDNLGEIVNSYKPKVHASKSFLKLCKSLTNTDNCTSSWQSIDVIQDKLYSEIMKTMKHLAYSEKTKTELERDVEQLRQQIEFQKNLLKKATVQDEKVNTSNGESAGNSENVNLMDIDINKLNELTSDNNQVSSNLNIDLAMNKSSHLNIKGKNLNIPDATVIENVSKKVISDVNKIQKTDEQENILVDSDNPSTSNEMNSSYIDNNIIDLTFRDDEDQILSSQGSNDETAINIKKYS